MIELFQIDSFTSKPFSGNPAAVCILKKDADESWMQNVAAEMNLSETAFLRRIDEKNFSLRWFTPQIEVDLCGHATLAAAHILWENDLVDEADSIVFGTRSGKLTCKNIAGKIEMNFPSNPATEYSLPDFVIDSLGVKPIFTGKNTFDYIVEVASESEVTGARVNFDLLSDADIRGVILTSRAEKPEYDFVSRFFAPGAGINEDPVTGSAHCCLGPYWAPKIGKPVLTGYQASKRGGFVDVQVADDRVLLRGYATTVFRGNLLG